MKEWFAKFMDMPVSVRVSVVFLSVVLSVVTYITVVNVPLLFGALVAVAAAVRLIIYFELGK